MFGDSSGNNSGISDNNKVIDFSTNDNYLMSEKYKDSYFIETYEKYDNSNVRSAVDLIENEEEYDEEYIYVTYTLMQ